MVALISTNSCLEESLQEALGITAEESVPCPNGTCHFWTQVAFTTEFHPIFFDVFLWGEFGFSSSTSYWGTLDSFRQLRLSSMRLRQMRGCLKPGRKLISWDNMGKVRTCASSQISMQRFFTFPLDVCCQSQVLSAGRFISSRSKAFTAMMTTIRWVWRWFWTGPKGWSLFKWLRVFRWEPSGASDHYSMYCLWTPMEGGRGAVSNSDCTWWLMAMAGLSCTN